MQIEFELPAIELAFDKSVHDISVPDIVGLHAATFGTTVAWCCCYIVI